MTITVTGSKYSGTITSVGTTTLVNSSASFVAADFNVQRLIGLWSGTTFKGFAYVRRWISATQLELIRVFINRDGNTVTQAVGDSYQISRNFSDIATTNLIVSGSNVQVNENLFFGTNASGNSVCFYDENKNITVATAVTQNTTEPFFKIGGGLVVFGFLENFSQRKTSRGCNIVNQNITPNLPNGTGTIALSSTAAKFMYLGGSIFCQSSPAYLNFFVNSSYTDLSTGGEFDFYWEVSTNAYIASINRSEPNYQIVSNIKSENSGSLSTNIAWVSGILEGGSYRLTGSAPLNVFGSGFDAPGFYTVSAPAGQFLIVNDVGFGSRPALWRSATTVNQTIYYINVVTPNRKHGYDNGSNYAPGTFPNNNARGLFHFWGLYTGLINNTLGVIQQQSDNQVASSETATANKITLIVLEATVTGHTEVVRESNWNYGFWVYRYLPFSGSFSTQTVVVDAGQSAKQVVFGGVIGQVIDTAITQTNASTVAAYTTIETLDKLYDYAQYWKTLSPANAIYPSLSSALISNISGETNLGTLNLIINSGASTAFSVNTGTNTLTIKASSLANGVKNSLLVLGANRSLTLTPTGTYSLSASIPSTGTVFVSAGTTTLLNFTFASGASIQSLGGNATVIVSNTTGIVAGTGVTVQAPAITYQRGVSGAPVGAAIFLGDRSAPGVINRAKFALATGNNSGNSTLVISGSIPADTPTSGFIRIVNQSDASEVRRAYTAWSGSTFTLSGTLPQNYTTSDTAYVGYLDVLGSSTGNEAIALPYIANRDCTLRVRLGSGTGKIQEISIDITLTNQDQIIPVTGFPDSNNNN
jgi:hypothetical protein